MHPSGLHDVKHVTASARGTDATPSATATTTATIALTIA
jgi:hypothetical protein